MYLFFDTKTNGLPRFGLPLDSLFQPRICQLGAILTDEKGATKAELNVLIVPYGWTISRELTAIHGISQEDAESYGVTIEDALLLFGLMAGSARDLVAHNTEFDLFMLAIECDVNMATLYFDLEKLRKSCTLELARDILKLPPTSAMRAKGIRGYKSPNLQEAYRFFFGKSFDGAHDAMADVRACRDVFFAIQNLKQNGESNGENQYPNAPAEASTSNHN